MKQVSEYKRKLQPATKEIINDHWPQENGKPISAIRRWHEYEFQQQMYKAQIQMIKAYFHSMTREKRARAIKTMKLIDAKLALYN